MAAAAAAGQVPGAQTPQNQQGNKQGQVGQAAGAVGGNRAPFPIPGGLPR
jgi:hypothetical protein